jgi:hypothetical protein
MKTHSLLWPAVLALCAGAAPVYGQGTAFTYQGRLTAGGSPANGGYDFIAGLYGDSGGANPVGSALTNYAVAVTNGLFFLSLDFGAGSFPGAARWLELSARSNGSGGFTGLRPLQQLTPAPYAVTAGSAAGLLAGAYSAAVSLTNAANSFAGMGAGLTSVNAATLGGKGPSGFWNTSGNAGADPATGSFLGTTDAQPLELRVNGARALRLEPTAVSPNVLGGDTNNTAAAGVFGVVIAGGAANYIDVGSSNCIIGGGFSNTIQDGAGQSTIAGGESNLVGSEAGDAAIGGGNQNAVGSPAGTIGGGEFNSVDGYAATVPGGLGNAAEGDYSFAAGSNAAATNTGAFVWADSLPYLFNSAEDNEFAARATGGVRFVSATDADGNPKAGVHLAAGGGSWASLSDRESKENLAPVDARQVLERLAALPVATWNYKSQAPSVRHIGPMAQDFAETFAVGEDARHITTVDASGVALAAIQGLNAKLEARLAEKDAEILQLRQTLAQLQERLDRLSKPGPTPGSSAR